MMYSHKRLSSLSRKKSDGDNFTFSKEITAAVVLKFLLLASLWWLFFKGHKQPVDGDVIATKLFGENQPVIQIPKSPENP
jgi:hypothetical protein